MRPIAILPTFAPSVTRPGQSARRSVSRGIGAQMFASGRRRTLKSAGDAFASVQLKGPISNATQQSASVPVEPTNQKSRK